MVAIGGQFSGGQDAIDIAERWKNAGYSSTYNINPTINTLNQNTLNSEIVYFSAHGDTHGIYLLNNVLLTDGLTSDTSDHNAVYIRNEFFACASINRFALVF